MRGIAEPDPVQRSGPLFRVGGPQDLLVWDLGCFCLFELGVHPLHEGGEGVGRLQGYAQEQWVAGTIRRSRYHKVGLASEPVQQDDESREQ
jgi:hypothetical protein